MGDIKKIIDEYKKHLDTSYQLFLNKYKSRSIYASKKKIDQLYETTKYNLEKEEHDFKNKQNKYSIHTNDEIRKLKFISELYTIVKNNDKQMRLYIDEKYIYSMMVGEDKNEPTPLLLQTNRPVFQSDDELAKIIGGKKI